MPRVTLSNIDADPYYRILGNRPEILAAWAELDKAMLGAASKVPVGIKEEARRALAQNVGCAYCATVGGKPSDGHADPKLALAVAVANQIATDYTQIDDSTFEALREEFSNDQIVELLAWLCFKFGSNLLGALVKLEPATEVDQKGYNAFVFGDAAA
jgi:alkylhydroperoxidase family enzyme